MSLRRIFLLGTATLAGVAALVAIGTVLAGSFGETEGKIFATLATTFVAGTTLVAALSLLERGEARALGFVGASLAVFGFVLWTEEVWAQHDSDAYWQLLGVVLTWVLGALLASAARLMTRSARLLETLYPATVIATAGAGVAATVMILRSNGDGWQIFAILLILALLGEILAPVLQRFESVSEPRAMNERVLAKISGAIVIAARTTSPGRIVELDGRRITLADDEMIVVEPG